MIVQLAELFINTDNIVTLSMFEQAHIMNEEQYIDTGLTVNGKVYTVYTVKADDEESVKVARQKTHDIVATIINLMSTPRPVQRLNLGDGDGV